MLYKRKKPTQSKFIGNIVILFTMPFIWAPFIPTLFVDVLIVIYVHVCFPIYGLEKPIRSNYIQVWDRNKLAYLTWYEKLGCMYCGYMNGVFRYFKEVSGRTEKYWCGIMHKEKEGYIPHYHQSDQSFVPFDDKDAFDAEYNDV